MLKLSILIACLMTTVSAAKADVVVDTNWCFEANSSNRLIDQPMDREYCAALQSGGLAASWFGVVDPSYVSLLFNSRQNEWAQAAAQAACMGNPVSDQVAVRLIQACQCHNAQGVVDIENNQTEVLQTLRARGGC